MIVTLLICLTLIYLVERQIASTREQRQHVDAVQLGAALEEKLKSMEELKVRMEHLLIKNGLGRPNG